MPYANQVASLLPDLSPSQFQDFFNRNKEALDDYKGDFLLAISDDDEALVLFEHQADFESKQEIRDYFDQLHSKLFHNTKATYLYGIDDTVRIVCSNTALVILTQEREMALYLWKSRH